MMMCRYVLSFCVPLTVYVIWCLNNMPNHTATTIQKTAKDCQFFCHSLLFCGFCLDKKFNTEYKNRSQHRDKQSTNRIKHHFVVCIVLDYGEVHHKNFCNSSSICEDLRFSYFRSAQFISRCRAVDCSIHTNTDKWIYISH